MADSTAGLKDIAGAGRKHYVWLILLVAVIVGMALYFRNQILTAVAKAFPSVGRWFGVALASLLVLLFGGDALASTCCGTTVHANADLWGWTLTTFGSLLGLATFGMISFGAPDVREAKLTNGAKSVVYTPANGVEPQFDFYVDGKNPVLDGRPVMAVSQQISLTTQVVVAAGSHKFYDDDGPKLLKNATMQSGVLGTLLDATTGTGPLIKAVIEFFGLGFTRGSDDPISTMTSAQGEAATSYVTHYWTIPHAQNWHKNPILSALWLGIVNNMKITPTLAAANGIGANLSTAVTGTLKVSTPVVPASFWAWPLLNQWTLESSTIPGGSGGINLRRFGEQNAAATVPVDYVYAVLLMSNLIGLPGNQTLDNIASVNCPTLGISDMSNLPAFTKARLDAQHYGRSPIFIWNNPNYRKFEAVPITGGAPINTDMNLSILKFLALRQPGLDGTLGTSTLACGRGFELPIEMTYSGSTPSANHAVMIGALRKLDASIGPLLNQLSGGNLSATPDYDKRVARR
jgi:hypothetical protein